MKTGLLQSMVLGAIVVLGGLVSRTDAAVIAYWDFGTSSSPTLLAASADANVTTVGAATQGSPSIFEPTVTSSYVQDAGTAISGYLLTSSGPMTTGLTTQTSATLASNNNYWSIKVTADSGYTLDIDKLAFDYSFVSSNRGWALGYVMNDGSVVAVDTKLSAGSTDTSYRHIEYSFNLTAVTSIEFRWYGLGNNSNPKNLQFDNLTVNGTVVSAVVPEPATVCLLLAGVGVMGISRRR